MAECVAAWKRDHTQFVFPNVVQVLLQPSKQGVSGFAYVHKVTGLAYNALNYVFAFQGKHCVYWSSCSPVWVEKEFSVLECPVLN